MPTRLGVMARSLAPLIDLQTCVDRDRVLWRILIPLGKYRLDLRRTVSFIKAAL